MGRVESVVGLQWGDEGKGALVDRLAKKHHVIVRFAGGGNAGHTIVVNGEEIINHHIPSGILYPGKVNVLGNGMVLNLDVLANEIESLQSKGVEVNEANLSISDRAHITTPYQLLLNVAKDVKRDIGTTLQGIGSTYAAKVERSGLRMTDLLFLSDSELEERIRSLHWNTVTFVGNVLGITTTHIESFLEADPLRKKMARFFLPYFNEDNFVNFREVVKNLKEHRERFAPFTRNIAYMIWDLYKNDADILFEGAQGCLLDIDHGTYPYCTSSNTGNAGAHVGGGIYIPIQKRTGVLKAYVTRVGGGPFPTEETGEVGERLGNRGGEFGATTGRRRRCGWQDFVAAKYAVMVNGITHLAITKLDVLDEEPEIKYCVAYEIDGKETTEFPSNVKLLEKAKPVYQSTEGWQCKLSEDISQASRYFFIIEHLLGVPVKYISFGKERSQFLDLLKHQEE